MNFLVLSHTHALQCKTLEHAAFIQHKYSLFVTFQMYWKVIKLSETLTFVDNSFVMSTTKLNYVFFYRNNRWMSQKSWMNSWAGAVNKFSNWSNQTWMKEEDCIFPLQPPLGNCMLFSNKRDNLISGRKPL